MKNVNRNIIIPCNLLPLTPKNNNNNNNKKGQNIKIQKPFLPYNFMNNKTKQRPKISILSRLIYNPKKQVSS